MEKQKIIQMERPLLAELRMNTLTLCLVQSKVAHLDQLPGEETMILTLCRLLHGGYFKSFFQPCIVEIDTSNLNSHHVSYPIVRKAD